MSVIKSLIRVPGAIAHKGISRRAYLAFARKYDFVYFGYVNQQTDEQQLVRGITLSAKHVDTNYCIGNFNGYDAVVVQRQDTVSFPGKADEHYTWNILQIDLDKPAIPHVFIDAHHHNEAFYANLFLKFDDFKNMNSYYTGDQFDPKFIEAFKLYGEPKDAVEILTVFNSSTTQQLSTHFRQFDFELLPGGSLLVYSSGATITLKTLENMLRAGTWLAEVCNTAEF